MTFPKSKTAASIAGLYFAMQVGVLGHGYYCVYVLKPAGYSVPCLNRAFDLGLPLSVLSVFANDHEALKTLAVTAIATTIIIYFICYGISQLARKIF